MTILRKEFDEGVEMTCMIFLQKTAPGISGMVFLIIGILLLLLALDWLYTFTKTKIRKRIEKNNSIESLFPEENLKVDPSVTTDKKLIP